MKQIPTLLIAFILGMTVTTIVSWKNNNNKNSQRQSADYNTPNTDVRQMIAIRRLKLKQGVSPESFEKFITEKLSHNAYAAPGIKEYVAKGERGDDVGNYIHILMFDSKTTRDVYFPAPGTNADMPASIKTLRMLPIKEKLRWRIW
jgi:hypothetical protein